MRILVIEDDEHKRRRLVEHLRLISADEIGEARSMQSGLRSILSNTWDMVVLDMTMPTFDVGADESGGRPQVYAGWEVLRQMRRKGATTPILMVTQFDQFGEGPDAQTLEQLDVSLREAFPVTYRGSIYYNVVSENWKQALTERVREIAQEADSL